MKEKWNAFRDKYGKYTYPFVYFLAFMLLDFSFRSIHSGVGSVSTFFWVPSVFTLCWSVIFSVIVFVIPGIAKKIVMSIFVAIFSVLCFIHATLYHVSGSFLSFSDLAFAEDGAAFVSIQYLGFDWKVYLFVFLSLAIGIFAILLAPVKQSRHWIPFAVCGVLLAGSITGITLTHSRYYRTGTGGNFVWTDTYVPGSTTSIYTEFSDPNECLMFCGNYQYLFRSLTQSVVDLFGYGAMRENLDEYYATKEETPEANEMTGVLKGQNAIGILLESIDTWMVTPDIMPNLYALKENSIDFENHYTPLFLSAGTFNTEFAFNIGYYLPSTGTSARTYATNVYPNSLPNLFRNAGYTANSYHTLDGRFYNRQVVHLQWGYESFNDHDDMEIYGNQAKDTTLMEAYDMFVTHSKPFFDYIITYSGHGPYTEERDSIAGPHMSEAEIAAINSGVTTENANTWDQYVRAIAHAMETDAFIGQLVEAMTLDGTIQNTSLILFGDHYCKYLTDTDFVMDLKGATDLNTVCNTPFFIYSQKFEERIPVEKVTSSVDMVPTIANLFGLDYNARYLVGNDAFGDKGGFVCFKDYSWIDSEMYWTPNYEGEETEYIQNRCREARELLTVSWNTVKTNYFAHINS